MGDQRYVLGRIIVLHPGHPLVGRNLPVVRRYREGGQRLWVIELSDGSRQYLPAAWCTPLAPAGNAPTPSTPAMNEPPPEPAPSPLSLAGLRELAALVRRLRERGEAHGGSRPMWPPLSMHQNQPPARADQVLEEPSVGWPDRAGLPGWESFPAAERRHLLEVLVQTARHQVPKRPRHPLSQGRG